MGPGQKPILDTEHGTLGEESQEGFEHEHSPKLEGFSGMGKKKSKTSRAEYSMMKNLNESLDEKSQSRIDILPKKSSRFKPLETDPNQFSRESEPHSLGRYVSPRSNAILERNTSTKRGEFENSIERDGTIEAILTGKVTKDEMSHMVKDMWDKAKTKENIHYIKKVVGTTGPDSGNGAVTYEEFEKYFNKFVEIHNKCGKVCPHLRRFYERIGYNPAYAQRKLYELRKTVLDKLPKIQRVFLVDGLGRSTAGFKTNGFYFHGEFVRHATHT
eukprot:TRINITY_DN13311_c0_g1_i2.p1 TRINITY_DN13311_c0_g1~~TRINITY_DN13311_c0_g1_i2.p1  ORF type:complete len:272 (-),score=34.23 TRINITY_DN13311_c0_g1_i2:136-951(-)